jgi:RNA polymerase sigma factor (sigma-70 family)
MATLTHTQAMATEQDRRITEAVAAQRARLQRFVRRYVLDREEAEDILQDVFYELVDAYRLTKPIEQVGAWLYRVARNRIIDRFRKRKHAPLLEENWLDENGEALRWDELLPSAEDGPEAALARQVLMEQVGAAIADLPAAHREIFVAHELEGRSFKDLAAEMNISINTLLSRKHAAVNALRSRLQTIYQEFTEFGAT